MRLLTPFMLLVATAAAAGPEVSEFPCGDCHDQVVEEWADTVHEFLECTDCHEGAETVPHGDGVDKADCSLCHEEASSAFDAGVHGQADLGGKDEPFGCVACHGAVHDLVSSEDPASPVHSARLHETCGQCHANQEMAKVYEFHLVRPIEAYRASVHARAIEQGEEGADCSDCHGSHAIFAAADSRSKVNHRVVPETCGRCHEAIARTYRSSVHGRAVQEGVREAPVCTDCHGEHRILSPREGASPVFASNIPRMTCGRCHGDLRLAEKFGLPADKVPAYEDSYHGLALRSGVTTVAHCGSCHGLHDILPSSDPRSHVHKDNLEKTCGRCHPGAGATFTIGLVHVLPTQVKHAAIYYIRLVYLWIIYLVIGGMVLHNLLDFLRKVRTPPRVTAATASPVEERMRPGFRLAHGLLVVSFTLLVYTGFALKYPETWWARPLLHWESSLGLRGWLHRSAAVVMLAAVVFHFLHLASSRSARACIAGMRPNRGDLGEFGQRILHLVGLRRDPPAAGLIGYAEKVEYLSLLWGILVMTVTGFLLWFETAVLRWLPKWITDVAVVIHFYEAVLATLAILVWHLYFVIFDPVVYPMDTAWLTGRSPEGRNLERSSHRE